MHFITKCAGVSRNPLLFSITQVRSMATLKIISTRLKSVRNIQKITQSMKMVSAAKYARAERELAAARPIGDGAKQFYELAEVAAPEDATEKLIIAVTSDRGLCGAVHSSVSRGVRSELTAAPNSSGTNIVCVGDKSRAILQRQFASSFSLVASEVGRLPPTFRDACRIAAMACEMDFTSGKIFYNKFNSVVSYSTTQLPVFSAEIVSNTPKLLQYEEAEPEVVQSYVEFSLAAMLYYAMKEAACSELSARMTAMDNASKNATEMIDKLQLTFNRTRQAVITRELIEIISGASAL